MKARYSDWPWPIHDCDDGYLYTAPAGQFKANGFGLQDMLCNAWEWTQDCWNASYAGAPDDGGAWTKGGCALRVVRGGSWYDRPDSARSANRFGDLADDRNDYLGFRPARTF